MSIIFLFSDFGSADIYVGQVKAVLAQYASAVPCIDLLHDAPAYDVRAGAHLLAALVDQVPPGGVVLSVIDPGVGSSRKAAVMEADGRYFVGPDNGLLSVVAARAAQRRFWHIGWVPGRLSNSFHGRDLFAPVAAWIARGAFPVPKLDPVPRLEVDLGGEDLAEVIYIDHYGNAMTGIQAGGLARDARLVCAHRHFSHARVFSDAADGQGFWHQNSIGLAEIALKCGHAAGEFGLALGQHVMVVLGD